MYVYVWFDAECHSAKRQTRRLERAYSRGIKTKFHWDQFLVTSS